VQLAGTIVKELLYNADQIEKDVRVGDTVFVEKEEIIPKIIAVDLSERPENSEQTKYISHCPECQTELVRNEGKSITIVPILWMSSTNYWKNSTLYFEKSNGY
jgi:DNA ligase (NAD+)